MPNLTVSVPQTDLETRWFLDNLNASSRSRDQSDKLTGWSSPETSFYLVYLFIYLQIWRSVRICLLSPPVLETSVYKLSSAVYRSMRTWTSLLSPPVLETNLYMDKFIIFCRYGDQCGFVYYLLQSEGPICTWTSWLSSAVYRPMRTWTSLLSPLVLETNLYMDKFIIFCRSGDQCGFGQVISSGPKDQFVLGQVNYLL